MNTGQTEPRDPSRIDAIATRWSLIRAAHASGQPHDADTARRALVLRYARAIRRYVGGILKNAEDADELAQEAMVRLMKGDFAGADPDRGRFRDLLKTAVRNMIHNHWARANRRRPADVDPNELSIADEAADDPWLASWRQNVIDHAWAALREYEREHPAGRAHTALQLRVENPDDSSEELAERLSARLGVAVRADACRQMLRRARLRFAELLIREIELGLADPTPDRVAEELAAVGLLEHVRDFMPAEWSTTGRLSSNDSER